MPCEVRTEADLPTGDSTPRQRHETADRKRRIVEPAPFHWVSGNELSSMDCAKPNMIIDKIFPAGASMVICAKSKSGKSTLMAEFCHAICTGRHALGQYAAKQGPVLYWLADDSNVKRFARSWREVAGDSPVENFHLCVARQQLYPDGLMNLQKAVNEFKPVFIVVDSYTEVRSQHGGKTDFVKAEYQDMRRLSEFAAASGAALATIHHLGKAARSDPFDTIAGSFAVGAGSDARMVLEKLDGTQRLVRLDGRDLDEFQFVYARDAGRKLFYVIDGEISKDWQRIALLAARPDKCSFSTRGAAESLGLSDRQMRRVLNQWEHFCAVQETSRSNFVFSDAVIRAAAKCRETEHEPRARERHMSDVSDVSNV